MSLLLLGVLGTGCGVSFNQPPRVTEGPVALQHDVESGTQVQMHLVATDEEGGPLRYAWLQSPEAPAGSFDDSSRQEPIWTAPEVTQLEIFQLKVLIKDSEENTLQGFTSVSVYPRR